MKWFPIFLLTTLLIANAQIPINGGGGKGSISTVNGTSNQILCTTTAGITTCSLPTNVIMGTAINTYGELNVGSTSTTDPRGITSSQFSSSTDGALFIASKARGTPTTPTVITTGDNILKFLGKAYDGSNYLNAASIIFGTEGTIASTRTPTYIAFSTGTDAAPTVLTEAFRVTSKQNSLFGGTTESNYKLDVQKSGSTGTARFYDQTATTGSTLLTVQGGAGQSGNVFQILNNAGTAKIVFDVAGNYSATNSAGVGANVISGGASDGLLLAGVGVKAGSGMVIGFSSTTNAAVAADTAFSRCAAGAICAGTGASGSIAATIQSGVVAADPGCTTTSHIGKLWFDITTITTVLKVCMNVAGSLTWVTK